MFHNKYFYPGYRSVVPSPGRLAPVADGSDGRLRTHLLTRVQGDVVGTDPAFVPAVTVLTPPHQTLAFPTRSTYVTVQEDLPVPPDPFGIAAAAAPQPVVAPRPVPAPPPPSYRQNVLTRVAAETPGVGAAFLPVATRPPSVPATPGATPQAPPPQPAPAAVAAQARIVPGPPPPPKKTPPSNTGVVRSGQLGGGSAVLPKVSR